MGFHLSERRRGDTIYLYACRDWTDPQTHKRRKEQYGLGCVKNGICHFNDNAIKFAEVFVGGKYETQYWQWRKLRSVQETEEVIYSMSEVVNSEDRNAGLFLLCESQIKRLEIKPLLYKIFGEERAKLILSVVYFLVRGGRDPLYSVANWSRDQFLPVGRDMSEDNVAELLKQITPSEILTFMISWIKRFPREERMSLDITSVSSYSRQIPDVTWGYNRDNEELPQINLLMIVSQKNRLPAWIEQLPGAVSDVTTLKDVFQTLKQADDAPRNIVFDRGFASRENISAMLKLRVKFTMGVPLKIWTSLLEEARQLYENNEFFHPDAILDGVDYNGSPVHAVTRLKNIDGHRVYDHFYYTDRLATIDRQELSKLLKDLTARLRNGEDVTDPLEQLIVDTCFIVKTTPVRGLTVKVKTNAIALLRQKESGFFVIKTNKFKSAADAFDAYRLRDGVEKRFDDMKNQEDMKRLRVHSGHNMKSRIFLQFLAQILRCDALEKIQKTNTKIPGIKTVSDLYFMIESIRRIRVGNHQPFYKRPTKAQLSALTVFGVSTDSWPSMRSAIPEAQ